MLVEVNIERPCIDAIRKVGEPLVRELLEGIAEFGRDYCTCESCPSCREQNDCLCISIGVGHAPEVVKAHEIIEQAEYDQAECRRQRDEALALLREAVTITRICASCGLPAILYSWIDRARKLTQDTHEKG